jgi:hypothetical protein
MMPNPLRGADGEWPLQPCSVRASVAATPHRSRMSFGDTMHSRYLFLKCVSPGDTMWEKPSRTLRLSELQELVEADSDLRWGFDLRGTIPVKNSDGTIVAMPPFPGFSFSSPPDSALFFICYEFYDGLAIHPEGDERVDQKAQRFAEQLGAKLFLV